MNELLPQVYADFMIQNSIIIGKIPFAPDTPVTRNIMERANQTFAAMAELESLSQRWVETGGFGVFDALENGKTVDMIRV